jgi:hypothetical protein
MGQSDFESGSLPKSSFVRLNKIYTLNTASVLFAFGKLQPETFKRIHYKLCESLGC